jgi:catalase
MVPGIGPSPDKMLLGRLFSYPDTHRHRIGVNYLQLPVNQPQVEVHSYNKDGAMRYRHNGNQPVYAPNSYGGPQADPEFGKDLGWSVESGELGRYAYDKHADDDDFVQAGTLYREVMSDTDREHLASNIIAHASDEVTEPIQLRVIAYWTNVDGHLGARVAAGLGKGNGAGGATDGRAMRDAAELVAGRANRA